MPRYLKAGVIKAAHLRLSTSRATSRLTDYLIFKRALVLSGGPTARVKGGMKSDPYQQAIREWAKSGLEDAETQFFNPFESLDKAAGYRGRKYVSNGPDNTWAGWQSGLNPTPVIHVRGTARPKEFEVKQISATDLAKAFLSPGTRDDDPAKLPRLVDVAVWWLRSKDLEPLQLDPDQEPIGLTRRVVEDVDLTDTELNALFDQDELSLDMDDTEELAGEAE